MASTAFAASPLYYCPDRKADQQYSATKGPGCVPLVEKERSTNEHNGGKPQRDFKIDNLQSEVTSFLTKYRRFLDCCKTDLNELREIEELGDEVNQLLTSTQANLSNYSLASRGIMLREMIPRVAKARGDLKILRARLEKMNDMSNRRGTLSFEEAGRESQRIGDLEESIERDIRAPKLPGSAKTGADIGVAPAVGPSIGRSPKTGADIGRERVDRSGHRRFSQEQSRYWRQRANRIRDWRSRAGGTYDRRVFPESGDLIQREFDASAIDGGLQHLGFNRRFKHQFLQCQLEHAGFLCGFVLRRLVGRFQLTNPLIFLIEQSSACHRGGAAL